MTRASLGSRRYVLASLTVGVNDLDLNAVAS
jgi:hypothetical protein